MVKCQCSTSLLTEVEHGRDEPVIVYPILVGIYVCARIGGVNEPLLCPCRIYSSKLSKIGGKRLAKGNVLAVEFCFLEVEGNNIEIMVRESLRLVG